MTEKLGRRSFMKRTAILGASSIFAGNVENLLASMSQDIDIAVVTGDDYFGNTVKAVEGRVPVYMGTSEHVELAEQYLAEHD